MTRQLILIRHAKALPANPGEDDFDRVLNARGRRSAAAVGAWLNESGYLPDQVLCSPSARTRETCERMAMQAPVDFLPQLYLAEPDTILAAIRAATGRRVAVIGHNPGIGLLAAALTKAAPPHGRFTDYPTCATTVIDFKADTWPQIGKGQGEVANFITPRELTGD